MSLMGLPSTAQPRLWIDVEGRGNMEVFERAWRCRPQRDAKRVSLGFGGSAFASLEEEGRDAKAWAAHSCRCGHAGVGCDRVPPERGGNGRVFGCSGVRRDHPQRGSADLLVSQERRKSAVCVTIQDVGIIEL